MFERARERWRRFRATPPGRRFQGVHRRRGERSGPLRKTLAMLAGGALILAGLAMVLLPGPGLLCIMLGGAVIAEESRLAARTLDRIDLAIARRIARWRGRRTSR